jgi:hypothetical protein
MTTKRALCVGINEFVNLPRANWLYGCVNDANDMAAMLKSKYGFGPRDVTVLTDAKATKAAVMAKLESMVKLAEQGKVTHIIFTYSSHGTQVPDMNGDEPDRADEAFVAYDLAQDGDHWDPNTVIVDDELAALFARVPKGVLVEAFLDTCHSGSGLKAMDLLQGRRPKFLPPPTPVGLDDISDRSVTPFGEASLFKRRKSLEPAASAPKVVSAEPVLYAACRSDQTSSDATFSGRNSGAFTYYLHKELKKKATRPRSELLTAIRADLKAGRFDQVPQLEGPAALKKAKVGA